MNRLIAVTATALFLAGMPAWTQDKPAAPAMKCNMAGMMSGTMHGDGTSDVVQKLTAKKKELKLNDRQIREIAAALAAEPHEGMMGHDMKGMAGMADCCHDSTPAAGASEHDHHQH